MIGSDVLTRVQRQFGDEAAVQIDSNDVLRWINDGIKEIAVQNDLAQATGTLSTVAGTSSYNFPADMLSFRSLYYKGLRIKHLPKTEYDEFINNQDPLEEQTGEPFLYTRWANQLILYPKPATSETDSLKLLYLQRPTDLAALSETIPLPLEYHVRVVEYCLQQAYETDEDWDAASVKASQFDSGLSRLKEQETFKDREYYPTITTLPDDL